MKENINYPVIVKEGVFSREDKYRFHCWVNIDGEDVLCYMPSNFKFEKVYSIKGKMVLLSENTDSKSKFKYKVEAVKYRNSLMLLNFSYLNRVVEYELPRKIFAFLGKRKNILHERNIQGYKSDLYIEDTKTLIEIKSVLAFSVDAEYPVNYSSHMLEQLDKLSGLAADNINVYYFIIGLGPTLKRIRINLSSNYGRLVDKCRQVGVHFVAMNLHVKEGRYCINK